MTTATGRNSKLTPEKALVDLHRRLEEAQKKLIVLGTLYGEQELVSVAYEDFVKLLDALTSRGQDALRLTTGLAQVTLRTVAEKLQEVIEGREQIRAATERLNDVSHLIQR